MTPLKSKVLHRNGLAHEVIRVEPWILVLSRFLFCFGSWHFLVISCFCLTSLVEVYSISSKYPSIYLKIKSNLSIPKWFNHICSWYRVEPFFSSMFFLVTAVHRCSSFTYRHGAMTCHDGSAGAAGRAPGPWTPQRGATEGRRNSPCGFVWKCWVNIPNEIAI